MRMERILLSGALMLSLGMLSVTQLAEAKLPTEVSSAIARSDFSQVQQKLTELIQSGIQGKTLNQIIQDKELMKLITASEVIQLTGASQLDELVKSKKSYGAFLNTFLDDVAWMQLYLQAGLIPHDNAVSLRVLGDIWQAHGDDPDFRKYLSLATGTAAAWGAGNFAPKLQNAEKSLTSGNKSNPVWRYKFFRDAHKANKLHKNFINLKPWEIRFVSGGVWDDASLKYTQNTINIPPRRYGDACWKAEYCGTSEFGDTIQGPLFYVAWSDSMGQAQKTVEHGGVCGALSHVGHTAAAARGIPSYPVGQPGHCAYGFRPERGKWLGGFGGPDGGPHNYIFPGKAPTCINLMEEAFKNDAKVAKGYEYATVASVLARLDNVKLADEAWLVAIKTLPHNMFIQQDYQKFAKANNLLNGEQWYDYAQNLIRQYNGHGFAVIEVLKPVMPDVLDQCNDAQKLQLFASLQQALANTPTSWAEDITPILSDQSAQLSSNKNAEKYLELLLNTHMNAGDGSSFGKVLEWSINEYVNAGKGDVFSKAFSKAVAKGGKSTGSNDAQHEKRMSEAYGKAIVAAENARSLSAVRSVSEAAKAYQRKEYNAPAKSELDLPKGKLVSDKGYLRLSTSSGWDSPCDHLNVLTLGGGAFHTDNEEKPSVIVELPEGVDVSGVLVVKNHGNEWRTKKMKMSRSVDGATWFDIAETNDMPKQWKVEFKDKTPAKWIKIESLPNEKTPLHLNRILIFAK